MKAALITPFRDYTGGVQSVNRIICEYLSSRNISVDIITSDNVQLNMLQKMKSKIIGLPYLTSLAANRIDLKQYDFVISNGEFGFKIKHTRCFNIFHGSWIGYYMHLKNFIQLRERISVLRVAYIQKIASKNKINLSVSEFTKRELLRQNISIDCVIENCIDHHLFRPIKQKRAGIISVCSNNFYVKGIDILQDLAKLDIKIDCVTNGEFANLNLIAPIDYSHMPNLYNKYRIFILPSRYEGLSMAVLEAMACGLPVIIPEVGMGSELKKEIPEFVVNVNTAEAYIDRIKIIESDYENFCIKSRRYIETHHTKQVYFEKWEYLLNKYLNI